METRIGVGDAQAIRNYSTKLAIDFGRKIWWKKFIGPSENNIVHEQIDLQKNAGDVIQFDLSMRLRGAGVYGDDVAEGKEESLAFMVDEVKIDQIRKPVSAGGRMTNQRTLHDLRKISKNRAAEWMAEWHDEVMFCYASGTAGSAVSNEDAIYTDAAFAANAVEAPDSAHLIYGGDATSKATVDSGDKMSVALIQKVTTKAKMLNAENPNVVAMMPIDIEAEKHFLVIMSEHQSHDLRTGTGATEWMEIQKAAGQRGSSNPIFNGKLGMIDNTVLQSHEQVRRFSDYGSGLNVKAARALFLGRQAMTVAYGGGNGTRMVWEEQLKDYGNQLSVAAGMMFGAKKTRFKPKGATTGGTDFGVISIDTAAAPTY